MHGAVEREVELDVPLEPVDLRAGPADPAAEPGRVGDGVRDRVPVPGRRLGRGPSAQNSARARAKSPRSDHVGAYGSPVAGFDVVPVAVVRAERVVAERARADVDRDAVARIELAAAADHVDRRLLVRRVGRRPSRGGGPGIDRRPRRRGRAARRRCTWPQCGPTNRCTLPGIGRPFWATIWASASGCQRFGSRICRPGLGHDQRRVDGSVVGVGVPLLPRASRRRARTRSRPRRCGCRAPPASRPRVLDVVDPVAERLHRRRRARRTSPAAPPPASSATAGCGRRRS